MQTGPVTPMLIGVTEAAKRLGISTTTLYYLVETNQIPHKRIGRAIKLNVKAICWAIACWNYQLRKLRPSSGDTSGDTTNSGSVSPRDLRYNINQ